MWIEDDDDALETALAGLRTHDASTARVERVRARCVARMRNEERGVRNEERRVPHRRPARPWLVGAWAGAASTARSVWRRLEPAAVVALGALYLVAAWMSVRH